MDEKMMTAVQPEQTPPESDPLVERLAEEFEALCETVPEIRQVEDMPDEVVKTAVKENIPLFDAYLRHWYAKQRQGEEQRRAQRCAAGQSPGSLCGVFEAEDPRECAFARAFRAALS